MNWLLRSLETDGSYASLILRLTLGIVIWAHGAQKLLGWYGGYGFEGTMGFFTGKMGIPWIFALLVILGEFFGGIFLVFGFAVRFSALWVGIILLFAMVLVHWENGFFMNWFGNQTGEGIEFFLLFLAISLSLVITGGGKFSLDRLIAENLA
ncbi:DoxX family protein [Leptospira ryugenii]|uniref:DoxX family protein n=1 Tax=Leptospira ryugenii TaxID=1917863 RepID=A0A2P2DZH5_9LEPT|nr:DoxX family protein [Leptospira ryugenii]GBF50030.1 DoxX family protein [Leptospira ryugenii]